MNSHTDALAFLFQARQRISIVRRIAHRLALLLMPVVAAYADLGSGGALGVVAAQVVLSVRNRMVHTAILFPYTSLI